MTNSDSDTDSGNDSDSNSDASSSPAHSPARPGAILAVFVLLCTSALMVVAALTHETISDNQAAQILKRLDQVFPASQRDNDLLAHTSQLNAPSLTSGGPVLVYQAQQHSEVTGVIIAMSTGQGYNGTINLLIGIDPQGAVTGVRVVPPHLETPGLGDQIDIEKSDWMLGFNNRSLENPPTDQWAVKKDGGVFDAFTGATITPRAVVNAVRDTLSYFHAHRSQLLTPIPLANEYEGSTP